VRSLNKLFLCILILQVINSNYLLPKGINLSLNRIKKKIETAVKDSVKQTKESIKDYIKQEARDIEAKEADKLALAKAISIVGSGSVQGLDLLSYPIKRFLKKFNTFSSNDKLLCNQPEFVEKLNRAFKSNNIDKSRKILYEKIIVQYPDNISPFFKFASDIDKQETELTNLIKELQDLINKKDEIKNKNQLENLEQAVIKLDKIKTDFETLYNIANKLLVSF